MADFFDSGDDLIRPIDISDHDEYLSTSGDRNQTLTKIHQDLIITPDKTKQEKRDLALFDKQALTPEEEKHLLDSYE